MLTTEKTLRILIVDDNRDGADALGLLVEELDNHVHVTYGGRHALEVATVFRPDLILADLVMPDMDGFDLAIRLRQIPALAHTTIVAITGLKDEEHKALALKVGYNAVLIKPVTLTEIIGVLANVAPVVTQAGLLPKQAKARVSLGAERRLPMDEARRIRNERASKSLTQAESEAAICDGIIRLQEEYLEWSSEQIHVHLIQDLLVIRTLGVLTLGESLSSEQGRDLIKQSRKQLLELARPMLESLVHEATGVKIKSMHHDISTKTGEEVLVFSLVEAPRFG